MRTWLLGTDPAVEKLHRQTVLSDNLSKQALRDHLDKVFVGRFPNFNIRIYDVSKSRAFSPKPISYHVEAHTIQSDLRDRFIFEVPVPLSQVS